ncbi:MAG: GAF domain-containing protein [Chloroflexi bacterium]|nr:GAF domain-containing protein [Chloroflexota bacterium]
MSATSDLGKRVQLGAPSAGGFTASAARLEQRIATGLLLVTVALALAAAIVYPVLAVNWRNQPFFGALLTRTLAVDASQPVSAAVWPGLEAGLARLDRVVMIDDVPIIAAPGDYDAALRNFLTYLRGAEVGAEVTVTVNRLANADGEVPIYADETCAAPVNGVARCEISYPLSQFPDVDFLAFFVMPYVSGLITLGIGVVMLVLRPRQLITRAVVATAMLASVFMFGLFDVNSTYVLPPLWIAATIFMGGALFALSLIFPMKTVLAYRYPALQFVPLAASSLLTALLIALYYNPGLPYSGASTLLIATGFSQIALVYLCISLLWRRRRVTSAIIRDQINAVVIGVGLSMIVGVVWLANLFAQYFLGQALLPLNTSAAMPFLILPMLSMAYAVLQYRVINTDRVISQGITYGLMLVGLILSYFLLVLSISLVFVVDANNPLLVALTVFLVAVLFVPLRTRVQRHVDQVYFRQRTDYRTRTEAFAQRLTSLAQFDDLISAYRSELEVALKPTQVFIFLPSPESSDYIAFGDPRPETDVRFTADSPLVQFLRNRQEPVYLQTDYPWAPELVAERVRLMILKTLVIAQLRGSDQFSGFVCVGPPRSKSGTYTYEQIRFIDQLTSQVSVAVERAQVVQSLERRVRELDVLSQVSQAANFTIEFDDLLELISAQTGKLLDVTHLYITLFDPVVNELFHAFFLENGERYPEKEGQRWRLDTDLFGEVVRTGQTLRVADYPQALEQRETTYRFEDPALKVWMGVPLIAGLRTLGALSVGAATFRRFSDEQLRIFENIGSLAATSLDKSRLFSEANMRARQLNALNEISRQLVASESDLEGLLQLITRSAQEILNAEAGSLLLTVDDNSGDLEFRVSIGAAGNELVGSRLPSGRGLIGQVAATGEVVLVNDVMHDRRWGGELLKGEFQTNNILAVPLVTQERVIGVLEVLNKTNGGGFTPSDQELLTTYASQAAVAIENARLFQLTDLQLTERVRELETLERIDVELNRSLDLGKVAEITVRWAMVNSGATAGVLGLVIGEPPQLDVVYTVGYGDDEFPEGTEDGLWPLDRGIVGRVMRTRQAELVPDVSIDPQYRPSLKGSLSQITLPMLSGGTINALLVLETNREPRLRLADMPFLQRLAEHASIAIANAQLYAELTRANQSKSEFVGFVAHELKNPLTSIKGYSDVLIKGAVGDISDQQKSVLDTIRSNTQRMTTLISDLEDVTKLQTDNLRIDFSAVDFRSVVTETLRPLRKQIDDKQQSLLTEMSEHLPLVHADQNRLIQVLTNLVSNAHKYTPPEGEIHVKARVEYDHIDRKGRTTAPVVHVQVRDTGIGMSEEDLSRLFTPYFRSENPLAREQPGTGLGLTITQGIVVRHNGEIWVESVPGKGTTFHFTIPLAAEADGTEGGDQRVDLQSDPQANSPLGGTD